MTFNSIINVFFVLLPVLLGEGRENDRSPDYSFFAELSLFLGALGAPKCWMPMRSSIFLWRLCMSFDSCKVIIMMMSCRQHGYPWLSLATSSLSFIAFGWSSGLHPVSSHSCCMYVRAGRPAFAWPYVGVHRSTSLMSSSLLLQQCPPCLVRLTCIVFVMGGRWPYSWCLVGCCCQDLFNIAPNILCNCRLASSLGVLLPSNWCTHTAVSTRPLPGRNCLSFYRSGLISIWWIAYW